MNVICKEEIEIHDEFKEEPQDIYPCGYIDCPESFDCIGDLEEHQSAHYDVKCDFIDINDLRFPPPTEGFDDQSELRNREDLSFRLVCIEDNTRKKPVNCPVDGCNDSFISPASLNAHKENHSKLIECNQCDFSTNSRVYFVMHTHSHNGNVLRCPECDNIYSNLKAFKAHEYRNHPKPFPCQYRGCSEKFENLILRRRHEMIHKKVFKCDFKGCTSAFSSKIALKHHVKKHTLPFKCSCNCDARFARNRELQVHTFLVHKKMIGVVE